MGNWRTVNIIGTCAAAEVEALRAACTVNADYSNFHPLSMSPSLCGLNNWVDEEISVIGNLAERDYDPEDVAKTLETLVQAAPSLTLKVHCGGAYEDKKCVATIEVVGGNVKLGPPQVPELMAIPKGQIEGALYKSLFRRD